MAMGTHEYIKCRSAPKGRPFIYLLKEIAPFDGNTAHAHAANTSPVKAAQRTSPVLKDRTLPPCLLGCPSDHYAVIFTISPLMRRFCTEEVH
jgi:hypothetical protein